MIMAVCTLLLAGCASVGVRQVSFDQRIPEPERRALNVQKPGAAAQTVLNANGLAQTWARDPATVLRNLDDVYYTTHDRQVLYALAELSFLQARAASATPDEPQLLLSCVVYSYQFLTGLPAAQPGLPIESAAGNAIAFYNYALGRYLLLASKADARYRPGLRMRMLQGNVVIDKRNYELLWQPGQIHEYKVAYAYEAEGMEVYQVRRGLGVPLIVIRRPPAKEPLTAAEQFLPQIELTYAATAILRVERGPDADGAGTHVWHATIDICDPQQTDWVTLGARQVPLAIDLTTPLAYMIAHAPTQGGFHGMLNPHSYEHQEGLYLLQPYQDDRIPVLFVHGLMSSPRTWLQMLNNIMGDPVLRRRYQFWFFWYPTGNPMLYSSANLRASLQRVRRTLDPAGTNTYFNRMVVVGHSMGGLLSKTLVQSSGTQLWQLVASQTPSQLELTVAEQALINKVFFFEAQPFIARILFLATPHRGSVLAERPIARVGSWATSLPETLTQTGKSLLARRKTFAKSQRLTAARAIEHVTTGIDSLSPNNPTLKVLCELPLNVPYHSIIGNETQAGVPDGTDGVVSYTSAHLDGAQSELIVKSDHSVQENLNAIREVRRILLLHLSDRVVTPITSP
jgi:pimeloyl-ACP methyl ester carboxylesterase